MDSESGQVLRTICISWDKTARVFTLDRVVAKSVDF